MDDTNNSERMPLRTTTRFVKDPVHDYIPIRPRLNSFIDTRPFQRLRAIKQLGTSYFVWPGASHNRFEHCLGVAYLARLMAKHLQENQPDLKITDRDIECVELAGLCHDLGHGPWSHVWDNQFIPKALRGKKWRHEDASEMMFDYLVKDNSIEISDDDVTFVKALIASDPRRCIRPEKPFLFEIVSNGRNGIDVDKFDYILRDTHAIGEKGNLSLARLIQSARVIDDQICYDIKDANQIYELFYTRFSLHKRIYNHKTAKAIEYMIIDALLAAEPYLHIARKVDRPDEFVYLTDDIMPGIESNPAKELAESRAIFDRIRTRDLYKLVDYKVFDWEDRKVCKELITPERVVKAAKSLPIHSIFKDTSSDDGEDRVTVDSLDAKHVIVDLSEMHYGMKERNPLDSVKFYSKHNPNKCASAGRGDISLLMPAAFGEVLLRVYTRDVRYFGIIQAGYRAVLQAIPENIHSTLEPAMSESIAITPPATEAPSTPRSHSRNPSYTFIGTRDMTPGNRSFTNNEFTTVPPYFTPPSPTHRNKSRSGKRRSDDTASDETPSPPRKKRL